VKVKGASNATINQSYIQSHGFTKADNATTHVFSILIDNPKLLGDITDPAYQIDPAREQITINITDLRSTITNYPPIINNTTSTVILTNLKVFKLDGGIYSNVPLPITDFPYIDGSSSRVTAMPVSVTDNITLRFSPQFFDRLKAQSSRIYIALGFTVNPESTFLNNTQALPDFNTLDGQLTFNNPNTSPFYYDYNPANVTQPHLRDAVVEVAVWSGAVTSYGGGGPTPINGTHTIYASAGFGGTITPIGSVSVSDGATQLFTITNNTHYHITDVVVDGVSNGTISSYTFSNVTQDHTIAAAFAIDTYNITASAGVGGTITPTGSVSVNYGSTPTFTITKNTSYHIADVLVDGSSVGAGASYTFPAVTADRTINASFAVNAPASIFYNDFESGFSGWTTAGDVSRQTGAVPMNGTASIQLRNTGSMQQPISTLSHSSIGVSFAMAASSLDSAGERVYAEWYDGSTWTLLKQITTSGGENDNTLRYYSYSLPAGANHNANFQLRFRITGNANDDIGYVDNVQVTGIPD
jgi:hypothetical protein